MQTHSEKEEQAEMAERWRMEKRGKYILKRVRHDIHSIHYDSGNISLHSRKKHEHIKAITTFQNISSSKMINCLSFISRVITPCLRRPFF